MSRPGQEDRVAATARVRPGGRGRLAGRWGLRAKMTASYVLVTAAAVVLVEAVALGVVVPKVLSRSDRTALLQATAGGLASSVPRQGPLRDQLPTPAVFRLGEPGLGLGPGEAAATDAATAVLIPFTSTAQDDSRPMSLALLVDSGGRIVVSSYPARYPVGARLADLAVGALPAVVRTRPLSAWYKGNGIDRTASGDVVWAAAPVTNPSKGEVSPAGKAPVGQPLPPTGPAVLGTVYVQVPASVRLPPLAGVASLSTLEWLLPELLIGLLVLAGSVPVGIAFGFLSTRRLIGRLRRLGASTVAVADGDFRHRLPASGADEVAQLERNFNRMAERLTAAVAAERQLAGASERARIGRELHDSISQDLFSLRLLAGGLRKALPAGSPLITQVETMERTATGTMHEMQALLLELRPVALDGAGLLPALDELCRAYRDRLGVTVHAELQPVELAPEVEHAVLRIVQEALANAVKTVGWR
jgi:HAMP domain-containing protein